jgi:PAS domain-containing protein
MHSVLHIVVGMLEEVGRWTSKLSFLFASLAHRPPAQGDIISAAIVVSSWLTTLCCCVALVVQRYRSSADLHALQGKLTRAQGSLRFREALVSACPDAIAILDSNMESPASYRGGIALLHACLIGSDATALASKLNALLERGAGFTFRTRTAAHSAVSLRGCVVGSRAVVFMRPAETGSAEDYRTTLGIRTGIPPSVRAVAAARFDRPARDPPRAAAREGPDVGTTRRQPVGGREQRNLSMSRQRLPGVTNSGPAIDATATKADDGSPLRTDASAEIMDFLPIAVAVFAPDKRLASYNRAFVDLLRLKEEWLAIRPTVGDILDRLREQRQLPEQRDFAAWKRDRVALFEPGTDSIEEYWHLASGRSLRATAHRHLPGGVFWTFEDISDRLRSEASADLLARTHRATLNTVDDAIAIFGPDARLTIHNDAFARLWRLHESELSGRHLTDIAELAAERVGHNGAWNIVLAGINSAESAHYHGWIPVARIGDKAILLSLVRLPDGATLVTFRISPAERFEALLRRDKAVRRANPEGSAILPDCIDEVAGARSPRVEHWQESSRAKS